MIRIRQENINLIPGFWENTWAKEPPWREGFGIHPGRFSAMSFSIPPQGRVLDIGGGRGEFLNWVTIPCHKFLLEYTAVGTKAALALGISAVQGSCYALPYADNSFDAVVAAELIEHLEDPAACVVEMRRVCRRGGYLTVTTPNGLAIQDRQHIWSMSAQDVAVLMGSGSEVSQVNGAYLVGRVQK